MARVHLERLVSFDTTGVDHLTCLGQVQSCSKYSHFPLLPPSSELNAAGQTLSPESSGQDPHLRQTETCWNTLNKAGDLPGPSTTVYGAFSHKSALEQIKLVVKTAPGLLPSSRRSARSSLLTGAQPDSNSVSATSHRRIPGRDLAKVLRSMCMLSNTTAISTGR